MFYAPLSNLDIKLAAAASRLELQLSMLPRPIDIDRAVETIEHVADALNGEILIDLRAGETASGDAHWIVVQFQADRSEGFIHILLDREGDKIWVGQDDETPDSYSRFAHSLSTLHTRYTAKHFPSDIISGSLH